ncbi:MAG TPA: manganese catalase family protein [Stellaceae bacterium]|nr:manganese catalase family protein [Stellaceae bacterium]
MFFHRKEMMYPVRIDEPNPAFGQLLLEQFGGATGELTAALTYWTQSFHVENAGIRDMLQDIAIEEFSHLEMVAKMIDLHTRAADQSGAYRSSLFAIRGRGPHLIDSLGQAWTAAYVNEGGNVVRDLRSDIAAEAGARQTYEALIKVAPDKGSIDALTFLLTREISHTQMFMSALDGMGKLTDPMFGTVKPDETVDLYFNLSNDNDHELRGPWNQEPKFRYVANPQPQGNLIEDIANPDDEHSPGARTLKTRTTRHMAS